MSDENCLEPWNAVRRSAFEAGYANLKKSAKLDFDTQVLKEFGIEEIRGRMVDQCRVRGSEFRTAPQCTGRFHLYESFTMGRWYKMASDCPIWGRRQMDREVAALPSKNRRRNLEEE